MWERHVHVGIIACRVGMESLKYVRTMVKAGKALRGCGAGGRDA